MKPQGRQRLADAHHRHARLFLDREHLAELALAQPGLFGQRRIHRLGRGRLLLHQRLADQPAELELAEGAARHEAAAHGTFRALRLEQVQALVGLLAGHGVAGAGLALVPADAVRLRHAVDQVQRRGSLRVQRQALQGRQQVQPAELGEAQRHRRACRRDDHRRDALLRVEGDQPALHALAIGALDGAGHRSVAHLCRQEADDLREGRRSARSRRPSARRRASSTRAIQPISRWVMPCSTNRLKPTGGVICAISTTSTTKMPNHSGSIPALSTVGRITDPWSAPPC
jgi:hypothetical protein